MEVLLFSVASLVYFFLGGIYSRLNVSFWKGLSIWSNILEIAAVSTITLKIILTGAHWVYLSMVLIFAVVDVMYCRQSAYRKIDGETDCLPWILSLMKLSIVLLALSSVFP